MGQYVAPGRGPSRSVGAAKPRVLSSARLGRGDYPAGWRQRLSAGPIRSVSDGKIPRDWSIGFCRYDRVSLPAFKARKERADMTRVFLRFVSFAKGLFLGPAVAQRPVRIIA